MLHYVPQTVPSSPEAQGEGILGPGLCLWLRLTHPQTKRVYADRCVFRGGKTYSRGKKKQVTETFCRWLNFKILEDPEMSLSNPNSLHCSVAALRWQNPNSKLQPILGEHFGHSLLTNQCSKVSEFQESNVHSVQAALLPVSLVLIWTTFSACYTRLYCWMMQSNQPSDGLSWKRIAANKAQQTRYKWTERQQKQNQLLQLCSLK